MNSSTNKFLLIIRKMEALLRILNKVILAVTTLSAIILVLAFYFSINPELFGKTFIVGLVLITPVIVFFYISPILFLSGHLESYWVELHPVSYGIIHWGIFLYGSSTPDAQFKLFAIIAISLIVGIVCYVTKIYTKKMFLLVLLIVYWLSSINTITIGLSTDIKIGIASSLLFISLLSFVNSRGFIKPQRTT